MTIPLHVGEKQRDGCKQITVKVRIRHPVAGMESLLLRTDKVEEP